MFDARVFSARVDIARLYDQHIADHYDDDRYGLLRGGRALALQQLAARVGALPVSTAPRIVDLALGTGASLLGAHALLPAASLHGIDISARMLEIAKSRIVDVHAILDDAAHVGRHFEAGTVDVALMHFLTTYIDGRQVVADTARTLRPGSLLSIASTTWAAFPTLQTLLGHLLAHDEQHAINPAPESADVVAGFLTDAGLEVVERDEFATPIRFGSFDELHDFGLRSGFFTHIIEAVSDEVMVMARNIEGIFPFEDTYKAAVLLARKPG